MRIFLGCEMHSRHRKENSGAIIWLVGGTENGWKLENGWMGTYEKKRVMEWVWG